MVISNLVKLCVSSTVIRNVLLAAKFLFNPYFSEEHINL